MRKLMLIPAACLIWGIALGNPPSADIATLKDNFKNILAPAYSPTDTLYSDFLKLEKETEMSDQIVMELHQRFPFDLQKIDRYLSLLNADGSFSDINYADTQRSGWQPKIHAERVLELTKLYFSKNTDRYQEPTLKEQIHRAIGFWIKEKPKSLNWWQNEIGVPKTLGGAFIMLEDELSEEEKAGAIEVMDAAKFKMTGQNKVWLAGNVLVKAMLQNDSELIKAARDTIASEIRVSTGEGIQPDWCFHQHGAQQQLGNYGMSFIASMSMFKKLFDGTSYQFDPESETILKNLINDGYRWVIWHRYMDVNSLGRQLFHNAQLHKGYTTAFVAEEMGLRGIPTRGNDLVGHKHFSSSDFTVHRRPGWMASLKMSSARIIGSELVNEDNILGYYLGDGATYFYTSGDEYMDVFPFWDWRQIPGTTTYQGAKELPSIRATKSRNTSNMVGGINVGECGMSVMDFERDGLHARKAWIFAPDYVVCIGAGISSDSTAIVTTTIDQRTKKGDVEILDNGKWRTIEGTESLSGQQRILHDGTAYITLSDTPLRVKAEQRTGQWHDNMRMYRPETITGSVAELSLLHGAQPRNAEYAYIVAPKSGKELAEGFDLSGEVRILRNDSEAQVVNLPNVSAGYWAAVYTPGLILNLDGKSYKAEKPGIYYLEATSTGLVASEPTLFD